MDLCAIGLPFLLACLLICGGFYGLVVYMFVVLSGSKWERLIWILFTVISFYSSYIVIDFIVTLVK